MRGSGVRDPFPAPSTILPPGAADKADERRHCTPINAMTKKNFILDKWTTRALKEILTSRQRGRARVPVVSGRGEAAADLAQSTRIPRQPDLPPAAH
jgi:hypothetical protein